MKNKISLSVKLVALAAIVFLDASCQVGVNLGTALAKDLVNIPEKMRAKKAADVNSVSGFDNKFLWVSNNAQSGGDYVIALNSDDKAEGLAHLSFKDKSGITVTLKGVGVNRRVNFAGGTGSMITVGSGVTLILGEHITLNGHTRGDRALVRVLDGGTVVMKDGSIITGNINYSSGVGGGGVYVASGGTFVMEGGSIHENTYVHTASGAAGANAAPSHNKFVRNIGRSAGEAQREINGGGGGVYVSEGGFFSKTSGMIGGYGDPFLGNRVADSIGLVNGRGHAVYVGSGSAFRDATAGPGVSLSYVNGVAGGDWDNIPVQSRVPAQKVPGRDKPAPPAASQPVSEPDSAQLAGEETVSYSVSVVAASVAKTADGEAVAKAGPDSTVSRTEPARASSSAKRDGGDTLAAPPVADKGGVGAVASGKDTIKAQDANLKAQPQKAQDTSGASAAVAEVKAALEIQHGDFTDKSIDLDMIFIKGGTFTMGCTVEQGFDCSNNERPERNVTLSDFYIGKYEVTQRQWKAVMGDNPALHQGDSLPMENVTWDDVRAFIDKLNAMTEIGRKYRLPTEAEWEYAARGGARSKNHVYAGSGKAEEVAWFGDNGEIKTVKVGIRAPNEFGIYDMSGNVWELVGDWYARYDTSSHLDDPVGPPWGNSRTMRGGSWSSNARACRVSNRMSLSQDFRSGDMGFRLAIGTRELKLPEPARPVLAAQTLLPPAPAAVAQPTLPVRSSVRAERESPHDHTYKPRKRTSVGLGAFYGGDYGGGIAWPSGEALGMPYRGAGTYMFFDAVYAEVFTGYSAGRGKWVSPYAKDPNNLPDMSRTYLNIGVFAKYPLGGAGNFFPLLGLDYEASVAGKLAYENGSEYNFDIKSWRYDSDALSALWLKLGCGFNIDLIRGAYIRAEAMYGFRTANTFEKYDASSSGNAEARRGHGFTYRAGFGFKLDN